MQPHELMKNMIREENLLKLVVIVESAIFSALIIFELYVYPEISPYWKIALGTFILLLPFYFFIQVSLNVKYTEDNRLKETMRKLNSIYSKNLSAISQPETGIAGKNVLDPRDFSDMFKQRLDLLDNDTQLQSTYYKSYELLSQHEVSHSVTDNLKKSLQRESLLEFNHEKLICDAIKENMREEGISFRSYLVPLSFFNVMYLSGMLVTLPLILSVFGGIPESVFIPLFKVNEGIPIQVIQWGFLGGFVYTSISLLTRFLRNDLFPRVYVSSALRLLMSAVVPIIIYFFYMLTFYAGNSAKTQEAIPQILLLCFIAGVAPIQILVNFADTQMYKIYKGWKRMNVSGNRLLTQLEGVNSITAERLSEEGIECVQQMALCKVDELIKSTRFESKVVKDWKDQAVFLLLTGDVRVSTDDHKEEYLDKILDKKYGVKRITGLLKTWEEISDSEDKQRSFFRGLGLMEKGDANFEWLVYVFKNIFYQAKNSGY